MPFCPQCRAEYVENVTICPDCQVELVPELPPEDDTVEYVDWETVIEVPNELVGNMIKGVLEDEGIDVVMRSHEVTVFSGVRSEPEWGEILVHRDDLQNAKAIVDEYLENLPVNTVADEEQKLETV